MAQLVRQQVQTETTTRQESLALMKDIIDNSISCIAYLRGLFPDNAFGNCDFHGVGVKRIVSGESQPADELLNWISKGVFDALEKGYLKTIVLGIFEDPAKPTELIESYTFHVTYPEGNPSVDLVTESKRKGGTKTCDKLDIRKNTAQLLRTLLVLVQTLDPLPDTRYLTMKLHYYEDVTPASYEPPCFRAGSDKDSVFFFNDEIMRMKIGQVDSVFHKMDVKMYTRADSMKEPKAPTEEFPSNEQANKTPEPQVEEKENQQPPAPKDLKRAEPEIDLPVKCLCLRSDGRGFSKILCKTCMTYQHKLCAGIVDNESSAEYKCFACQIGMLKVKEHAKELCKVAEYRKAVGFLTKNGFKSRKIICETIGLSFLCTKEVIEQFKSDGLLDMSQKVRNGWIRPCVRNEHTDGVIRSLFSEAALKNIVDPPKPAAAAALLEPSPPEEDKIAAFEKRLDRGMVLGSHSDSPSKSLVSCSQKLPDEAQKLLNETQRIQEETQETLLLASQSQFDMNDLPPLKRAPQQKRRKVSLATKVLKTTDC